jgi:hypothetical protein
MAIGYIVIVLITVIATLPVVALVFLEVLLI